MTPGNSANNRPAMAAPAIDRTPRVTTTASQTRPAKVSKELGWALLMSMAKKAPPTPATNAPSDPTMILTCTTFTPSVLDAGSLSRTARSARPVVERRRLTMSAAKIRNTTNAR